MKNVHTVLAGKHKGEDHLGDQHAHRMVVCGSVYSLVMSMHEYGNEHLQVP
jgi:hypothetical protein